MRLSSFFLIGIILLLIPLALATTTVQTGGTHASGKAVTLSGTCDSANIGVGIQVLLGPNKAWIGQPTTDANKQYSAICHQLTHLMITQIDEYAREQSPVWKPYLS